MKHYQVRDYSENVLLFENCVKRILQTVKNELILFDAELLSREKRFEKDNYVIKIRKIIQTVTHNSGKMSIKQKWCLCRFLVKNHPKYEVDRHLDGMQEEPYIL